MNTLNQELYSVPVLKKNQPDDTFKFRVPPAPTGKYPYHLNIETVIPAAHAQRQIIHMVGDTGGITGHAGRHRVATGMATRYKPGSFLYHLGDLVYHHGEEDRFNEQFFTPFEQYPGPIFAIAGNHDTDVNPAAAQPYQSLDAFNKAFCSTQPTAISFAGSNSRQSMCQPNVYWTLNTPMATIIGLHSNVPKYGLITADQQQWLRQELLNASPDKLLLLCVHHAPYSADVNHGSSLPVGSALETAFAATSIYPDAVFSGHVHNYQRFERRWNNTKATPFIVAGAGGFDELHSIVRLDDDRFLAKGLPQAKLMNYYDDEHGFLELEITQNDDAINLKGLYFIAGPDGIALHDEFEVIKCIQPEMVDA